MANDIAVTEGSGKNVATLDRSGRQVQEVVAIASGSWVQGQANVTGSSSTPVAARADRKSVLLWAVPANTQTIFISHTTATTSDFPLAPGAVIEIETAAAILAIATSGTQVLRYMEVYN